MVSTQELNFLTALLPLVMIIFLITIGVILLNQHFRKNLIRQKLKQEELKNQYQHEMLRSSIDTQEQERKRIARDLHDEIGATLSITRMQLIQLEEKKDKISSAIYNVRLLTESALASLRRISHELMPPELEMFGIIKTLESVANRVNMIDGIQVCIDHEELPPLAWEVQLGLYRICLELMNNTIKHARASEIKIEINSSPVELTMIYNDNGHGLFDTSVNFGVGLKSLEARTNSLLGNIHTFSEQCVLRFQSLEVFRCLRFSEILFRNSYIILTMFYFLKNAREDDRCLGKLLT